MVDREQMAPAAVALYQQATYLEVLGLLKMAPMETVQAMAREAVAVVLARAPIATVALAEPNTISVVLVVAVALVAAVEREAMVALVEAPPLVSYIHAQQPAAPYPILLAMIYPLVMAVPVVMATSSS